MNHSRWKTRRTRKLLGETVGESPAYREAGDAFALGQAVHDRRTDLGFSQTYLARRADMTQPQISTIEGGDSVPALPLLTRLAKALDASLTIDLDGDTSAFVFTAHAGRASWTLSPPGASTTWLDRDGTRAGFPRSVQPTTWPGGMSGAPVHRVHGEEHDMSHVQNVTAADGGGHGSGGGDGGDGHPGTPWPPPQEPPSPDGDSPPGDGTHRK